MKQERRKNMFDETEPKPGSKAKDIPRAPVRLFCEVVEKGPFRRG